LRTTAVDPPGVAVVVGALYTVHVFPDVVDGHVDPPDVKFDGSRFTIQPETTAGADDAGADAADEVCPGGNKK
jgi:hypothetical protein